MSGEFQTGEQRRDDVLPLLPRIEQPVERHAPVLAQQAPDDDDLVLDRDDADGGDMRRDGIRAPDIAEDRKEIFERRREFLAIGLARGSRRQEALRHVPPPFQFGGAQSPRDLLKQLVLQQTPHEFGPRIIFPFRIAAPRQQELGLDVDQRRGQLQELAGAIELQTVEAVGQGLVELPGDGGDRNVEDVDVLRPNEVQEEIQGPLKAVELHQKRLCRPLARKSVGHHRHETSPHALAGGNRRPPAGRRLM